VGGEQEGSFGKRGQLRRRSPYEKDPPMTDHDIALFVAGLILGWFLRYWWAS
jgi:hypothetical protein